MTLMKQHGDDRTQIDFQISRIELFAAAQIDETAFIRKAVCQERKPNPEQIDLRGVLEKIGDIGRPLHFRPPDIVAYRFTSQSSFQSTSPFFARVS